MLVLYFIEQQVLIAGDITVGLDHGIIGLQLMVELNGFFIKDQGGIGPVKDLQEFYEQDIPGMSLLHV